jgi:hypothetical protein
MTRYDHLPLRSAYLCEDCQSIGSCSSACACCGSRSLLYLEPILNGRPPRTLTEDDQNMLRCWHIDASK